MHPSLVHALSAPDVAASTPFHSRRRRDCDRWSPMAEDAAYGNQEYQRIATVVRSLKKSWLPAGVSSILSNGFRLGIPHTR